MEAQVDFNSGDQVTSESDPKLNPDSVIVESFIADLIPWFLENRHKDLATLDQSFANGDLETIRQMGHTLKGTCGGYGFIRLSELGGLLEFEARQGNKARIADLLELMRQHLSRIQIVYNP